MRDRRHYAVGTAITTARTPEAALLSRALGRLLDERGNDGLWGGPDALDVLISTNHAAMTLLAAGFTPDAEPVHRALQFLADIDTDRHVSFFWRSGTLLNLPRYTGVVRADMEYLWEHRARIGAHKDYPIPFFLLKLIRFRDPSEQLSFSVDDVLRWIVDEFDERRCWYGRTSITSMALALVYDLQFEGRERIVERAKEFLLERFRAHGDSGRFDDNLVDDCFTVYNLCENGFIELHGQEELARCVRLVAERIRGEADDQGRWGSPPPFGGNVGERVYPTAVAVRALMSCWSLQRPLLINEVAVALATDVYADAQVPSPTILQPFWGPVDLAHEPMCFVLMPFSPQNLTDIYLSYVKPTIEEQARLRCRRADDFYRPTAIMSDIWISINRSRLVVADLTDKNANVFYELGLAHALGKEVILLAQSEDDIPFDLRGVRTILYENTLSGYRLLAWRLAAALDDMGLGTVEQPVA